MNTQTELFDVCARRHRGNAQSKAANRQTNKKRDRGRILQHLAGVTDATSEETGNALSMPRQTASARFSELKRDGLIAPTARRRTSTGCTAQAYKLNQSTAPC